MTKNPPDCVPNHTVIPNCVFRDSCADECLVSLLARAETFGHCNLWLNLLFGIETHYTKHDPPHDFFLHSANKYTTSERYSSSCSF